MAQNTQGSKSKWKVGSFLQQAVAGVESRLDMILAEEEDQNPLTRSTSVKSKQNESLGQQATSPNPTTSSMESLNVPAGVSRIAWLIAFQLFRGAHPMREKMIVYRNA
jgi:hypothetical protein